MRVQVTLTPPESKKLIAKAVARLDAVEKAQKDGIILVGASTTCAFVLEELTNRKITRDYGCGITIPRGTCIMQEMLNSILFNEGTRRHGRLRKAICMETCQSMKSSGGDGKRRSCPAV